MNVYVCPECKKLVTQDKLHGGDETCKACNERLSVNDCYMLDTDTGGVSNLKLGIYAHGKSAVEFRVSSEIEKKTKVIHNLSKLELPAGYRWEEMSESKDSGVIVSWGNVYVGILVWMVLGIPFVIGLYVTRQLLFFLFFAIYLRIFPFVSSGFRRRKIRIYVTRDMLTIETGIKGMGKRTNFVRYPKITTVGDSIKLKNGTKSTETVIYDTNRTVVTDSNLVVHGQDEFGKDQSIILAGRGEAEVMISQLIHAKL